jgi:hypothetical protein
LGIGKIGKISSSKMSVGPKTCSFRSQMNEISKSENKEIVEDRVTPYTGVPKNQEQIHCHPQYIVAK